MKGAFAAARKAVRRALLGAPLFAALLGGASPARAGSTAVLNININISGIGPVNDLTAVPGSNAGTIGLSWTEPYRASGAAPFTYEVRASSLAQISDDTAYSTAALLSTFSPDVPPAPGPGGGAAGFLATGLQQGVTYFFAIREKDSTSLHGTWLRSLTPARNVNNFAIATPKALSPAGGSITATYLSSVTATWAITSGATDYFLAASTNSANPPSPVAASTTTFLSTGTVAGLAPNTTYFLFAAACGGGCSNYTALGSTVTLAAPAVALSSTSLSSSTVSLAWGRNGNPLGTTYLTQKSTDGVNFSVVAQSSIPAAFVSNLTGGVTYYFEIISVNFAGVPSAPSNILTLVMPSGPAPSTPTGLTASGAILSVSLSWTALPAAQQGSGLVYYALQRSLNSSFGFVTIATTSATSFNDHPLAGGTTFYYRLIARDTDGIDSAPSAAVAGLPFAVVPMEPLGIKVVPTNNSVTLSWSPTTRFVDGTPFLSTGAPTADELQGYSVYRSTGLCDVNFVQLSSITVNNTTITDITGGANYYYRLFSFNTVGFSSNVVTISSLGERAYLIDDCVSRLVLDDATATTLNAASNGVGDIRIARERRPQDVGNGVFQSASFRALLNGVSELKGYALPKPARVVLHFNVAGGAPVADATGGGGFTPLSAAAGAPSGRVSDLGMYWFNGAQYMKMYGRIDALAQTVEVESPNLGIYQIRALARAAGAVFDVSNLSGRVITPNGDGLNDTMIFSYDPGPRNVVPTGRIFDLRGAFVAEMTPGLVPNTLTWNGYMNGLPVTSGVYVYRIVGDGKTFTGTIVVAH